MKKIIELLIILVLSLVIIFIGKSKLAALYYNRGNDYYERGLYQEAADYFNKSLKIDAAVAIAHYGLANAYLEQKLEDKAIEEYKTAIKLDRGFVPGYESLAYIYTNRQNYQEAANLLKQAEDSIPGNQKIRDSIDFVSWEFVANCLNAAVKAVEAGNNPEAYELINKALQVNPDFGFSHYVLGYVYYSERKYTQAKAALNAAVRLDKNLFFAYKLLGDIYFDERNFYKSVDAYKTALTFEREAVILNNTGLAYMNLEKYEAAIPFLKEALALDPENINICYSLASVYRDSGRLSEAVKGYKKVISLRSDYTNVHNDLGDIYKQQKLNAQALEEYRKEVKFCKIKLSNSPKDPILLNGIAYAYNNIGEYGLAKEFVNKALNIKPDYREAYLTLSSIYTNSGDSNAALTALGKAKKLSSWKYFFIEKAISDVKKSPGFLKEELVFYPTDTIYLKNGRNLKGIIKESSQERIVLEVKSGEVIGTVTFSKNDIERIVSENNHQ
ncbi:MAG: tetratricopeptide repeat protein [Candidatus Omnitrophica bacterium]|nr:tetratricopeptide repeat protein [Candidatus Omnitrophota bacterium]